MDPGGGDPETASQEELYSATNKGRGKRLIEQGLTSPPTQYRLSGRQFCRSKDPTNSIKVLKENKNKQIGLTQKNTISAHTYK